MNTAKQLNDFEFIKDKRNDLIQNINLISIKLTNLYNVLNGIEENNKDSKTGMFPLLEESLNKDEVFCVLESISVDIKTNSQRTNFILVPSEKEIENRLEKQIKDSWKTAVNKTQDYLKKIKPNHEVIIQFDKRLGFYKGNSLGIALMLSFIEELLKFYNSNTIIKVQDSVAITGGLDEDGRIIPTSKKIIEKKVEGIFFFICKNICFSSGRQTICSR